LAVIVFQQESAAPETPTPRLSQCARRCTSSASASYGGTWHPPCPVKPSISSHFPAEGIINVIESIGAAEITTITTDGAAAMNSARSIVVATHGFMHNTPLRCG
jgi:hypothetical protein